MEERSFLASDLLQCTPAPQSSLTSHTGIQSFSHPEKWDRAAQTRPSTRASTGTSAAPVTDQGLGTGHNRQSHRSVTVQLVPFSYGCHVR